MKKRPRLTVEHVNQFFANAPEEEGTPQAERHTYLVPDVLHEEIKKIAEEEGVGISEIVVWVLKKFVHNHRKGVIKLPVEEYITTKKILDVNE